jgi:hypothetical protein
VKAVLGGILGAVVGFVVGVVIHVVFWNNAGWADLIPSPLPLRASRLELRSLEPYATVRRRSGAPEAARSASQT